MSNPRKISPRSDTLANWTAANPLLSKNEMAVETDTGRVKYGTGSAYYNNLAYFAPLVPIPLPIHTVANVPTAANYTGAVIYISNETGGAVLAFSDGTNWRRVTDRAIIS